MNRSCVYITTSTVVLLTAMIACVLPGQTMQPAPVANPINIETAVAGTAQAAEQQTQQANAVSATETFAPTDAPTPTPKVSSSGAALVNLADGSVQFLDYAAGVQMVLPAGFIVFRVGEPEYYAAWERPEMQNPEFRDIFSAMQNLDPKNLRAVALDARPEHMPNGILTGISVIFLPGDTTTLEEWEKDRKSRRNPSADYKFISSSYSQTTSGIRDLVVELSYRNQKGTIYERPVYFSLPSGTLHIDLETDLSYKDAALLEFDRVLSSLTLLHP